MVLGKWIDECKKNETRPPSYTTYKNKLSPGQVIQLVGELFPTTKGCGFDLWSGHIPRL